MKLVQINVVCNGSTGKIMCDIAKYVSEANFESYCFFGRGNPNNNVNCMKIESKLSIYLHVLLARLGFNGHGSYFSTKRLVKKLKKINPDIIHLHNIHGYYLNLKVLFKYLKNEYKGKIVWTLHDCWAFTGHCSHFTMAKCNKWKKECFNCPQLSCYPKEYLDTTNKEFKMKRKLFLGLNNLTIVTPSIWLKDLVKKSFLKDYNVEVINNGIDLNIFKPTYDDKIYDKYKIPRDKKIILGVSNVWTESKGLYDFIKLSKIISKDMIIVLVGVDDKIKKILPENILVIKRTDNQKELAKIYTIADVFFNPSLEETFSLVTVEAINCGTPAIVCNTSAVKELISKDTGIVVKKHNAIEYYDCYKKVISSNLKEKMLKKNIKIFDDKLLFESYLKEYSVK